MGVAISSLIEASEIKIEQLQGKIIAVDAMNMVYQFITTIRQHDGTPLKDSKGRVTSHLTGLFSRCTRLMQKGLKLVFVFDGKMPALKKEERARRDALKLKAIASFEEAKESQDVEGMKKFAGRSARVTPDILRESKELLAALGIPVIQAPSEGEAQAAHMVNRGDCDIVASQDFDCLIYGAKQFVRNLSISQKRKKINALTYKVVLPEVLTLKDTLHKLDLNLDQLRALAMLIGTDFNVGGVKGLGPKKGIALVKEFGNDFPALFQKVEFEKHATAPWEDIFDTIKNIPTTDNYTLEWHDINKEQLIKLLVEEHDFSQERVDNAMKNLEDAKHKTQQTSLGKFLKKN